MAADLMDASGRPVVKTLLLTDFVDSTRFVATLGDVRAAQVFAEHDHLTRQLLNRMGGQEIDKSDGFLFLFDRPIDSVRFSMAYHRLLRALSKDLPMPLQARTGIHLGEVVLRTNPVEDVRRGAKPVEVEGLAKATSARVMSAAAGGQTLLSESAYSLAARGAVGAEFDGEPLKFHEHGAYALKGLTEPLRIYEVGLGDQPIFRAPKNAAKADGPPPWMPIAIAAAAVALLALAGFVGWWMTRGDEEPAAASADKSVEIAVDPAPEAEPTEPTEPAAEAVDNPPAPAAAPAAAPVVEPTQMQLGLRIESEPAGAVVSFGADALGKAPATLNVPATEGTYPVTAKLAGHQDTQAICRVTAADLSAGSAVCRLVMRPTAPHADKKAVGAKASSARKGAAKKPKAATTTARPAPAKKKPAAAQPAPKKQDNKAKIHMID